MAYTGKKVFLASDIMSAFIDRMHPKHDQARAFFRFFALESYILYTDIVSIHDAYRKMETGIGSSVAKDFLRSLYMSSVTIIYPDESDTRAALKIYINDKSGDLSFQKCLMMVISDRRGIGQIVTFEYIHAMFGLSIFYIPL